MHKATCFATTTYRVFRQVDVDDLPVLGKYGKNVAFREASIKVAHENVRAVAVLVVPRATALAQSLRFVQALNFFDHAV